MTPITREEIDELERLCREATPPPWIWDDGDPGQVLLSTYDGEEIPGHPMIDTEQTGGPILDNSSVLVLAGYYDESLMNQMLKADRDFIAAARNALPRLIARIRELEAALKPFAGVSCERRLQGCEDCDSLCVFVGGDDPATNAPTTGATVGDCRHAAAVLAKGEANAS